MGFFIFWAWKILSWIIRGFFKKFPNYKQSFLWENIRHFLILGLESSISQNIRKNFFWEKIRKLHFPKYKRNCFRKKHKTFFLSKFFSGKSFEGWVRKVHQIPLKYTIRNYQFYLNIHPPNQNWSGKKIRLLWFLQ